MPRFAKASARTVYPFMEVELSDSACPVTARILAYNPFVPSDVPASSWPIAVVEVELTNPTQDSLSAAVSLACENFVGTDGIDSLPASKRNQTKIAGNLVSVLMDAPELPTDAETRGDFCIAVERSGEGGSVSRGLEALAWSNDTRKWFDQFADQGTVSDPEKPGVPMGSVCLEQPLPAGKTVRWRFFVAWRFPNRLAWSDDPTEARPVVGNFYSKLGRNSLEILKKFTGRLRELRKTSISFTHAFAGSDLPIEIREAALANLPALRSQTLFRTPDGVFFGYEGGHRNKRSGGTLGSCTHVWGYDLATSFLFPEIARSFRALQFGPSQFADGAIVFRTGLPLERALRYGKVAADGQLASIIGYYRDARQHPDPLWARAMWPNVRKALEFCWAKGSWDHGKTGVMRGCQHNTMDVDYYGENPLMQGLYVTALRCGAVLAERFGDADFANQCQNLAGAGQEFLESHLFNGDYFLQNVPTSSSGMEIDPRTACGPTSFTGEPDYQVGSGVLIDQMMGGLHARVCGLEEPAKDEFVRRTLKSIKRFNFRPRMGNTRNHMRSYALGNESAVIMASWPKGGKPEVPFPYYCEVMTGFEHLLAAHLLFHHENRVGLKITKAIRSRYTGCRRNPFNEAEWGNHYARALASWASVWAWTGQQFDSLTGLLSFKCPAAPVHWPWFAGEAWGTVILAPGKKQCRVQIRAEQGSLAVRHLRIGDLEASFGEHLVPGVTKNLVLKIRKKSCRESEFAHGHIRKLQMV